jgi:hypothetical protein
MSFMDGMASRSAPLALALGAVLSALYYSFLVKVHLVYPGDLRWSG